MVKTVLFWCSVLLLGRCEAFLRTFSLDRGIPITHRPSSDLHQSNNDEETFGDRRFFLLSTLITAVAPSLLPLRALAGIDVSGLQTQRDGGGNPNLQQQLKSYDGSASTRVQEIKGMQQPTGSTATSTSMASPPPAPPGVATWALRATEPTLTSLKLGTLSRYQGQLVSPEGPRARNLRVSFEFPADWLALDRASGCVQYVDQRNGDKVYLLRATLPPGETLATLSKAWIGNAVFDPTGSLVKAGQPVEDYKVVGSQTLVECPNDECATRRRFKVKYATVTGNGLRVERRGLVDAYQIGKDDVYMCLASCNANKWENGPSRETIEAIVDSFRVERY